MSRTSKLLQRVGVACVAMATIGAGVPALVAATAQAAGPATSITISPPLQTGAAGTCLTYTVSENAGDGTAASSPSSVTVQLQDASNTDPTASGAPSVRFCTVDANNNATVSSTNGDTVDNLAGTRTADFALVNGRATLGVYDATPETITIRAFNDTDNNRLQGPNEVSAQPATANFTAGGPAGTGAAADAVTTVTATPKSDSRTAGSTQVINVLLQDNNNNPVPGVQPLAQIESGPNAAVQPTIGTPGTPARPVTCGTTNNAGQTTCSYTGDANKTGTDLVRVFVNRSNGTVAFESGERSDTAQRTNTARSPQAARNVDLKPDTLTSPPGSTNVFTATVVDVNGVPVAGVQVTFTVTGIGRLAPSEGGGNATARVTGSDGTASVLVSTANNESGTQTVTADIATTAGQVPSNTTNQCTQNAGTVNGSSTANAPAGNCTDRSTNTVTGSPSPASSPPASTPPASTPPASTPAASRQALTLSTSTPLIPAGASATLTGIGSPNQAYELRCYTRPSTTYTTARAGSFNAAGDPVTFTLNLGRNTRCFLQYAVNSAADASDSLTVNVQTVLSLSTVRTGVRTYVFQGRNLPRVSGQLITLYRVDSAGNEIRTTNLITDDSGIYRVTRTFTGTGTYQFKVRTTTILDNAAGVSNTISVRVF